MESVPPEAVSDCTVISEPSPISTTAPKRAGPEPTRVVMARSLTEPRPAEVESSESWVAESLVLSAAFFARITTVSASIEEFSPIATLEMPRTTLVMAAPLPDTRPPIARFSERASKLLSRPEVI